MGKVGQITENTAEDFIDEGVSNLVYSIGNCYFGEKKSIVCKDIVDNAFKEALEGAGQTLKFSIMNAVIYKTTEYALVKLVSGGGLIYLWLKKRRVVNKIKKGVVSLVELIPFKGKALGKGLDSMISIANGDQAENLKTAGMVNDSLNNMTTVISRERQTATMQVSQQKNQVLKSLGLNSNAKGLNDKKALEIYHHKMRTGTWTVNDKEVYTRIVPKKYWNKSGFSFSASFVNELNKFKEYAVSAEGDIMNLAQTQLDINTNNLLNRVK
jgi:hypothetical protein